MRFILIAILLLGTAQAEDIFPDFDNNGVVDFQDFLRFAGKFGTTDTRFDLDRSGRVDFSDFLIFVSAFGKRLSQVAFNIEFIFVREDAFTPAQKEIIFRAGRRWEQIITDDLPDRDFSESPLQLWSDLLQYNIFVSDTIDDLRIFVDDRRFEGNITGRGGPFVYSDGTLPFVGHMAIDREKLVRLDKEGSFYAYGDSLAATHFFYSTALHEIGHILGIGTLWHHSFAKVTAVVEGDDNYFPGPLSIKAFDANGGLHYTQGGKVPLQQGGLHWEPSIFLNELMSVKYSVGFVYWDDPISLVTIQALADLGYTVDISQADSHRVFATKPVMIPGSFIWRCSVVRPILIVR